MKTFVRLSLLLLLLALIAGGAWYLTRQEPQTNPTNSPSTTDSPQTHTARLKGCDISHWNGEIDWPALTKTDIHFLFIKATQGNEYTDPKFEENWASAKNYGFHRGAYHFYAPHIDPKEQADYFLSVVQHTKGDILPVLDIEISHGTSPDQLSQDVAIWVQTVEDAIGRPPMIYTDGAFWNQAINQTFAQNPLWIAEWETNQPPLLPNGWSQWVFWQYSATGTVKGIPATPGKTDLDYFNGDLHRLRSYVVR